MTVCVSVQVVEGSDATRERMKELETLTTELEHTHLVPEEEKILENSLSGDRSPTLSGTVYGRFIFTHVLTHTP